MVINTLLTKEDIFRLLSSIPDPEIPVVSIEEMGMLKDVIIGDEGCEVIITPTYTGCPAMGIIEDDILDLLNKNHVNNPSVKLVYTPAWTTDDMKESTKEKLKEYGIAPPVHSSCTNWLDVSSVSVECPKCGSENTKVISHFGSTACKALYKCTQCQEPFEYFKCH